MTPKFEEFAQANNDVPAMESEMDRRLYRDSLMNEQQWLTADNPMTMLDHLHISGEADEDRLWHYVRACREVILDNFRESGFGTQFTDEGSVFVKAMQWVNKSQYPDELPLARRCDFIHDVWGNPFAHEPGWDNGVLYGGSRFEDGKRIWEDIGHLLTWHDGTIPKLAERIHEDYDWPAMGILYDALQEADYQEESLLNHLRGMVQRPCQVCEGKGVTYGEYGDYHTYADGCRHCGGDGKDKRGTGLVWGFPRLRCKCGGEYASIRKNSTPPMSACLKCHEGGPFWGEVIEGKPAEHVRGCWVLELFRKQAKT